jgi:hydrogenase-4 component E
MRAAAELLLVLVVLADFMILGTSRLTTCIRAIAFQGLMLGLLPIALTQHWSLRIAGLALGSIVVKSLVLPWLLKRAIREAAVRREVEPRIGFSLSLVLGIVAVAIGFGVAQRLPLPQGAGELLVAVALATVIMGFLTITTRAKAVTQVVGYLMLENGIYLFGLTSADRVPFLVEIGVLLDVFVGVFIMGIVVFHINREFDSISSARLTELHD